MSRARQPKRPPATRVADGNYRSVRELLWSRATTIAWLDYGFAAVLWRGLRRTITRCVTGQVLWHGNRESLRRTFLSRESILLWIITSFHLSDLTALRATRDA